MRHDMLPSSVRARRGHYVLESGHHSDMWLDLETLCLRPAAVQHDASQLAAKLRRYEVDAVCGPLNEGAFVGLLVASALDCEFTYAERFAGQGSGALFPVQYRLPDTLREVVRDRRVAIVNDVTSAGSAVRGTFDDLSAAGANVVAIASLLVLGSAIHAFARDRGVPVEAIHEMPHDQWAPGACPLCAAGLPIDTNERLP